MIRRLGLHTDPVSAPKEKDGLFAWMRSDLDGTLAKEVEQDAARAGLGSSIAFAHVGLPDKDALVTAIVAREAATRTLDHFGPPKTPEGQEARNALLKQQSDAAGRVKDLLAEAITNAQVFQGGGQAVDDGNALEDRLRKAAADGAARLFSKFALADASGWAAAYQDAAKGLVNALERVGHMTAAETHPVAMEILGHIGSGSIKGGKLRESFVGAPYGWSNEAVLAALAVLFTTGQLKITSASGQPLAMGKFLERDVNHYAVERENTPLSISDKRAIARLIKCKPDDAETEAPRHVARLKEAFFRLAGPAPRPAPTLPALLDDLDKLSGKDLVKRVAVEERAVQQLAEDLEAQEARIKDREPRWLDLGRLVGYLDGDATAEALKRERQAVLDGRHLLAEQDPVPALVLRAADALRAALNQAYAAYGTHFQAGVQDLQQQADWQRLPEADQASILAQAGLSAPEAAPVVGSLQELLASLAQCTPQRWQERQDAIAGKIGQARAACAKKLEPQVQPYHAPQRMVRNEAELDAWLVEVRAAAIALLPAGPVQL
jgi:hypothetical protein